MKKLLLLNILILVSGTAFAQEKTWSVQAGIGEITMKSYSGRGQEFSIGEDIGNEFNLSVDYFLTSHIALTGGISYEQQGLFTDYSSSIGLKKTDMLGPFVGGKYYFFPSTWIIQPYAGASVYTNFLNLGTSQGEKRFVLEEQHPGTLSVFNYKVKCPALSLSPKVGVDIHLFSSLSLTLAYEYRFGLWGTNSGVLQFKNGPLAGKSVDVCEKNRRSCISFGLKLGFPVKGISGTAGRNIMWLIYDLIDSKRDPYGY
ncbi:MAG: outer membrane beta-barrel protein [Bacteroidales bacterium]|nr:outer membrane beta-barrel protein [Bacteroidales bacterium]